MFVLLYFLTAEPISKRLRCNHPM